ncbi:hypothetical protein SUGI_0795870 [Cryptomeria japonica]|uniref:RING-H2 finger protein ATL74 n=1 Tax=Cryptomeria japonica TaxID=3369 RepID=UPI002414CEB1|nr:RING-H2 finger protein ATL74 [Cryptomeria japonica]GLJ39040.1 hypothetical protein SUGI_0795870 [Cryptomeria japonica]
MSLGFGRRLLLAAGPARAPLGGEGPEQRDLYMNEARIDSDLVVILAALLCALICALGLNTLLKCALRCTRRMVFESSDDVGVRLANTGLKKAAMKALPVIVYTTPSEFPGVGSDCPICLAEFVDGDKVRVLPKCNHGFHVECIDRWLASHSSCPTCRHCLKKKSTSAPVTCNAQLEVPDNAVHVIIDAGASEPGVPHELPPAVSCSPAEEQSLAPDRASG